MKWLTTCQSYRSVFTWNKSYRINRRHTVVRVWERYGYMVEHMHWFLPRKGKGIKCIAIAVCSLTSQLLCFVFFCCYPCWQQLVHTDRMMDIALMLTIVQERWAVPTEVDGSRWLNPLAFLLYRDCVANSDTNNGGRDATHPHESTVVCLADSKAGIWTASVMSQEVTVCDAMTYQAVRWDRRHWFLTGFNSTRLGIRLPDSYHLGHWNW